MPPLYQHHVCEEIVAELKRRGLVRPGDSLAILSPWPDPQGCSCQDREDEPYDGVPADTQPSPSGHAQAAMMPFHPRQVVEHIRAQVKSPACTDPMQLILIADMLDEAIDLIEVMAPRLMGSATSATDEVLRITATAIATCFHMTELNGTNSILAVGNRRLAEARGNCP